MKAANEEAAKEAAAMKAAEDEAPHTTNEGGAWGELSPDKLKDDLPAPDKGNIGTECPASSQHSEKPVPRTSFLWTAIILIIAATLLSTNHARPPG